jgi:glycerophosphoryl diester phosphodiesterase
MYTDLPRPTLFAHRGASAHAPENTLAAFSLAVRQQADAIELDVKLSADGQVVIIHDASVDRTTNGSGQVNAMPLAALKELDAGSHFDIAYRGERIPTLEEYFDAVGRQTFTNIELTNYAQMTDALPERVADLVIRHKIEERVMFSSFNPIALRRIHRRLAQVPVGLLALPGRGGAWARSWLGRWLVPYQALHPEAGDIREGLVRAAHQRNCRVYTYTVNEARQMQRLFGLGVDGIFTDDPVLARLVLSGKQANQSPAAI